MALRDHPDVEQAGVASRLVDRILEVQLVGGYRSSISLNTRYLSTRPLWPLNTYTMPLAVAWRAAWLICQLLQPSPQETAVSRTFFITITAQAGTQQVDGVSAYLNFDPAKNPAGMTIADTGTVASTDFFTCPPQADVQCKPDGQDFHDVVIEFAAAGSGDARFTGGETYTGTLPLDGTLATDFEFLSTSGNCAAARVHLLPGGTGRGRRHADPRRAGGGARATCFSSSGWVWAHCSAAC